MRNDSPTIAFDGYDATIEADPAWLIGTLVERFGLDVERMGSRGRWSAAWDLTRNHQPFAFVSVADSRPDEPFLECKSTAPLVVPVVRELWTHRVARVDTCIDFHHDDWWDFFEPLMFEFAKRNGIFMEPVGAHLQPHLGGRTWYLGKRGGARLVRLYEKGCEQKLTTRNPIRLEHEVRPHSRHKSRYATMSEAEILLDNRFLAHALHAAGIEVGECAMSIPRKPPSELDRLLDVMARQYLSTFRLAHERFTTMAEFVADLEMRRERDAEVSRAMLNSRPSPIAAAVFAGAMPTGEQLRPTIAVEAMPYRE